MTNLGAHIIVSEQRNEHAPDSIQSQSKESTPTPIEVSMTSTVEPANQHRGLASEDSNLSLSISSYTSEESPRRLQRRSQRRSQSRSGMSESTSTTSLGQLRRRASAELTKLMNTKQQSTICGIKIINSTKDTQLKAVTYIPFWGHMSTTLSDVEPSDSTAVICVKRESIATGTSGIAVWKIGSILTAPYLVVMWSIPWNHFIYNNVLAVGIRDSPPTLNKHLFDEMYSKEGDWFKRGKYGKGIPCAVVRIEARNFAVTASMTTEDRAEASVEVKSQGNPRQRRHRQFQTTI